MFELIPRKLSAPPKVARSIIDEYRALYAFLERAGGLAQAKDCQNVLDRFAPRALEAAMSDPSKFGMAKSLVMGGLASGSEPSLDAFLRMAMSEAGLPEPPGASRKPAKRKPTTPKAPRAKTKPKR